MSAGTILLIEDEMEIADLLRMYFENEGFTLSHASSGEEGLKRLEGRNPRAVLLDIGLPGIDGIEVCRRIRGASEVPIIMLTARDAEVDKVVGLELGADDYVTKPFSPRELVARVKAILRRAKPREVAPAEDVVERGGLRLDRAAHRCSWEGREVVLTSTEFALLGSLMSAPGRVYSREELVEHAWGRGHHITDRTVDSHIRRVRKKFAELGADPIETVYGVGYRLRA